MHNRRLSFAAAHFVATAVISGGAAWIVGDGSDQARYTPVICWTALFLLLWCPISWVGSGRRMFGPYGLFLGAVMVFNAAQLWLECFGLNAFGLLGGRVSPQSAATAGVAVVVAISWMHLGALMTRSVTGPLHRHEWRGNSRALELVAIGLLGVSIVPVVMTIIQGVGIVIANGYFALFQADKQTGVNAVGRVLSGFFVPGVSFWMVANRHRRRGLAVGIMMLSAYAAGLLFLGSRSSALLPIVAVAWLWHATIGGIPAGVRVLGAVVLLAIVAPMVKLARGTTGADRTEFGSWVEALASSDNPAVGTLSEFGGSMVTVAYTMEDVPRHDPFELGANYLYSALMIVPNVFGDLHPSIVRGTAASRLTGRVNPYIASIGGSLGFSFVAELFLEFGWVGVTIGALIFGVLICRAERWLYRGAHIAHAAAVAAALPSVMFFARAESIYLFRPIVWYVITPLLSLSLLVRLGVGARQPSRSGEAFSSLRLRQGGRHVP